MLVVLSVVGLLVFALSGIGLRARYAGDEAGFPPVGDLVADPGDKLILRLFRLFEKLVGLLLCDLDQLVLEVRLPARERLDRSSQPVPRLLDLFDQGHDIAAPGRLIVPATHAHSLPGCGRSGSLTASPLRASRRIGPSAGRR